MKEVLVIMFYVTCLVLEGQVNSFEVPHAPVVPMIDGHADFIWQKLEWSPNWRDIVSSEEALYRTRFKALWDERYLYLYFEVIDPDIKAQGVIDHEPLFQFDNIIEVFLDAGADQRDYYELQINAGGTRWELTLDQPYKDGGAAKSPDELEGLTYAIHLDGTLNDSQDKDHAWYLEMRLPWSAIPGVNSVPPSSDFKANFSRVFQDDEDIYTSPTYWLWQPMGLLNIHIPDRWGKLVFLPKN